MQINYAWGAMTDDDKDAFIALAHYYASIGCNLEGKEEEETQTLDVTDDRWIPLRGILDKYGVVFRL